MPATPSFSFFFFNDTATTEIYTLSLHDALPILRTQIMCSPARPARFSNQAVEVVCRSLDRKSTRLNSSHLVISYAVFCLKKKKNNTNHMNMIDKNLTTESMHSISVRHLFCLRAV